LRIITLAETGISSASIPELSNCLRNKRFLTKLLLDHNRIGPEGARTLAAGIKENETLTNLHLSNCFIGEEGAIALSAAL